jgi:putative DNA primase/helicase
MPAMSDGFRAAIAAAGLEPPAYLPPGRIVRFPGHDKRPSNRAGWALLFEDGRGGVFGDWSTGMREVWTGGRRSDTVRCQAKTCADISIARHLYLRNLNQRRRQAARLANERWQAAGPVAEHPYLTAKRVRAHGLRCEGGNLLVPVEIDGRITSLQTIGPSGEKFFLRHGEVGGGCFRIGTARGRLFIAEGYATGATLFERTGHAVAVAFNAGNIPKVAQGMRARYPDLRITIAADNDRSGLEIGRRAANLIDADLIYPDFTHLDGDGTDFNDYVTLGGAL